MGLKRKSEIEFSAADPKEQLKGLVDMAVTFNSDLTFVVGCDGDEKPFVVGVVARGPYAAPLDKWLKGLQRREDRAARKGAA